MIFEDPIELRRKLVEKYREGFKTSRYFSVDVHGPFRIEKKSKLLLTPLTGFANSEHESLVYML